MGSEGLKFLLQIYRWNDMMAEISFKLYEVGGDVECVKIIKEIKCSTCG